MREKFEAYPVLPTRPPFYLALTKRPDNMEIMDDFGAEPSENGGLFLAIIFGMIGMLTLGVTASSLKLYRSINAVQFDGIGVYFYLFGVFPVEITESWSPTRSA